MPERRKTFTPLQENKNTSQQQFQQTGRVRHIQEEQQQQEEAEQEEEMVEGEAMLYIKELMEDWSSINWFQGCKQRFIKQRHKRRILGRNKISKLGNQMDSRYQVHLCKNPLRKKSQPNILIQT